MIRSILTTTILMCAIQFSVSADWNILKKEAENAIEIVDEAITNKLNNAISTGERMIEHDTYTLSQLNLLKNSKQQTILDNNARILYQKGKLKQALKNNAGDEVLQKAQQNIIDLQNQNNTIKKDLITTRKNIDLVQKEAKELKDKVEEIGTLSKFGKTIKKVFKYEEAIKSFGSVTGEVYAWNEGNSSFKNVVLKTISEGTRAGVVIGSGVISGTISSAFATPVVGTAVGLAVSNAADYFFKNTIKKAIDRMMDKEHDNINQYKQDPEVLERLREERRQKAIDEQKKHLKEIGAKQEDYNSVLKKFIDQQNAALKKADEDSRIALEEERKRQSTEKPVISFVPSKPATEPGKTIKVQVKVDKGLLPITLSGAINTTIESNADRGLLYFEWTPTLDDIGVNEWDISAVSASGKTTTKAMVVKTTQPDLEIVEEKLNEEPANTSTRTFGVAGIESCTSISVYAGLAQTQVNIDLKDATIQWSGNTFYYSHKKNKSGLGLGGDLGTDVEKVTIKGELSEKGETLKYIEAFHRIETKSSEFFHQQKVRLMNIPIHIPDNLLGKIDVENQITYSYRQSGVSIIDQVEFIEVKGLTIGEVLRDEGIYSFTSKQVDSDSRIIIDFDTP